MKIQFIIVGWHFESFPEFIDGLIELQDTNSEFVDIFWSCHKEPSQRIKDHFQYKVFPNLGLEDGAYQQALDYLNLDDNTILFLMHDDIVVKDWNFINVCLNLLNSGKAFIGNGQAYYTTLDPYTEVSVDTDKKQYKEWVKPEAQYLFETSYNFLTIRESFMCTTRRYLKQIHDFEVIWKEPIPDANGKYHLGSIGNLQQALLSFKITKVFGLDRITFLSSTLQDSEFLYECARGVLN
jgi:hypothetical protein